MSEYDKGVQVNSTRLRVNPDEGKNFVGKNQKGGTYSSRPIERPSNISFVKNILHSEFVSPTQDRPHNTAVEDLHGGNFLDDLGKGASAIAPFLPFIL